nr:AMP-binding protein [Ahniella affigens]
MQKLSEALIASGRRRIASRLDNGPHWLALDLALRSLGLVHVPLPTFFSAEQVAHALAASGADLLVVPVGTKLTEAMAELPVVAMTDPFLAVALPAHVVSIPADTAVITFTSGTTGTPKGVCLDATALMSVAQSLADAAAPLGPKRHLCLMPLSTLLENIGGVYAALLAGAEIVVPSLAELGYSGAAGLDVAKLLARLHADQPESMILVPQLLLALVMAAEQGAPLPHSFKFIAVGGARVGGNLIARAKAQGLPIYEGYGLSECASVVCLNQPGAERAGSVGRPLSHAQVTIIDGEVVVQGVGMLGYLGEPERQNGPITTGDLGYVDADGFVHITGRRKNLFITSFGRNVSPEWVESELHQHPAIAQAVVFGEARPFNVAVLWPRDPNCSDQDLADALAAANRGLPDYARVQQFVRAEQPFTFADGLLTSNGRPRRERIHARYEIALTATNGASE